MRRLVSIGAVLMLALVMFGCGGNFKLPTETAKRLTIPSDQSYQMVATWSGMNDIRDILVTQGSGTQLFVLFNHGGTGTTPRGEIKSFPRLNQTGTPDPIPGIDFPGLFNPYALCAGGDGLGSASNRVFVLDRGDTCLARANPTTHNCSDTTGAFGLKITDLRLYWRVHEFGLLGGDTASTFTDTTMAYVNGIAADAQGRVYVSGLAIILVPDQQNSSITTRTFHWRIRRYARGPRYPGVLPADRTMPGANWHRDTTWVVEEGSGIGTVFDPRGLYWGSASNPGLYVADYNKNWVQKLNVVESNTGIYQIDGILSGRSFNGPLDVTADLANFAYIADSGNGRVLRYDPNGGYVQDVNIEADAFGSVLVNPVAVAANDSLVFVGDAGLGRLVRYKRRK